MFITLLLHYLNMVLIAKNISIVFILTRWRLERLEWFHFMFCHVWRWHSRTFQNVWQSTTLICRYFEFQRVRIMIEINNLLNELNERLFKSACWVKKFGSFLFKILEFSGHKCSGDPTESQACNEDSCSGIFSTSFYCVRHLLRITLAKGFN